MNLHQPQGCTPAQPLKEMTIGGLRAQVFEALSDERSAKRLSAAEVQIFEGGQAIITNDQEGYHYVSDIVGISVANASLGFRCNWCVKQEGSGWCRVALPPYNASLEIFNIVQQTADKLVLYSPITYELVTLLPKGKEELSRAEALGVAE